MAKEMLREQVQSCLSKEWYILLDVVSDMVKIQLFPGGYIYWLNKKHVCGWRWN